MEGAFFFSQKNTEEQNTQHSTEGLRHTDITEPYSHRGLTPSPSPNGEGSDYRGYPCMSSVGLTVHLLPLAGQ